MLIQYMIRINHNGISFAFPINPFMLKFLLKIIPVLVYAIPFTVSELNAGMGPAGLRDFLRASDRPRLPRLFFQLHSMHTIP